MTKSPKELSTLPVSTPFPFSTSVPEKHKNDTPFQIIQEKHKTISPFQLIQEKNIINTPFQNSTDPIITNDPFETTESSLLITKAVIAGIPV